MEDRTSSVDKHEKLDKKKNSLNFTETRELDAAILINLMTTCPNKQGWITEGTVIAE